MTRCPQLYCKIWVVVLLVVSTLPVNANEEVGAADASEPGWPWTKLVEPEVPQVRNKEWSEHPIDAFVLKKLEEQGLQPASLASPRALLRRIHFGLVGLPPDSEQMRQFLQDPSPEEYRRRVDQLLGEEGYGERWARHWLDLVRYADTQGAALDYARPHMWRYRDYVIRAFNQDRPYDRFVREQIAADAFPQYGDEGKIGLALLHQWVPVERTVPQLKRRDFLEDVVGVTGSVFMGVTLSCARCHDHKYDPIGIEDYYRFRSIFDPAFPLQNWQQPGNRLVDMTAAAVNGERARIEAEAKKEEGAMNERRRNHCAEILEKKLADVPECEREETRKAVLTGGEQRTQRQKDLLEGYPMVKPVDFISGLLVEYDGAAHQRFEKEKQKVAAIRARKPPLRMIMATTEPDGDLPVSKVFFRGNPESAREVVVPAELMVIQRGMKELKISPGDKTHRTSERRLAYARHLTGGSHPLTARVFVNRVWAHHFGRGLVATPGDFGIAGERPSHPELLDWLARDFMEHGWNLKRLHRMILLSRTYQQSSRRRVAHEQIDPENVLLGRANLRRLEAEAIRDALLAVSGKINLALGGVPSPVAANGEGKAVLGGDKNRRSAFVAVERRLPLNMLETFDQPVMAPNCNHRRQTMVATQALWFLNDAEVLDHADTLARSLMKESDFSSVRLGRLYLLLFSKPPTPSELQDCEEYLASQREQFAKADPKADAEHRALASLCQVMLASNRFLYVD